MTLWVINWKVWMKAMREVTLLWSQYYPLLFFPLLFDYVHIFSFLWNKLCPCADTFFGKVSSIWIGGYLSFILLISQTKKKVLRCILYVGIRYIIPDFAIYQTNRWTRIRRIERLLIIFIERISSGRPAMPVSESCNSATGMGNSGTSAPMFWVFHISWLRSRRLSIFNHCLLASLLSLCFGYFIDGVIPLPKL